MMNMKSGEKTNFICNDWFNRDRGFTKDIAAKLRGKEALESKKLIFLNCLCDIILCHLLTCTFTINIGLCTVIFCQPSTMYFLILTTWEVLY